MHHLTCCSSFFLFRVHAQKSALAAIDESDLDAKYGSGKLFDGFDADQIAKEVRTLLISPRVYHNL
jgi:hypothetical protein